VLILVGLVVVNSKLTLNNGQWQQINPNGNIPKNGNAWHAAASTGGSFYSIGGDNPSGGFTPWAVQKYTPSSNAWEQLSSKSYLPTNFIAADLDATGGLLFAFGGAGNTGANFSDIYFLSTTLPDKGWNILEDDKTIPQRNAHTMTNIGGVMYVYGGWNGTAYFGDTWWFDTSALYTQSYTNWSRSYSDANPPPRNSHSAVEFAGQLIVFGGFSHNTSQGSVFCNDPLDDCIYFNDVWSYSPFGDKWTQLMPAGDKPIPRWGHSASVVGENMYIFGGTNAAGQTLNDLWAFNFPYGVWQKLSPGGTIPGTRYAHSQVTIGDAVYLYGGSSFSSTYRDLWVFTPHKGVSDTSDDMEQHTLGLKACLIVAILLAAVIAMFAILVYRHVSGGTTTYSTPGVTSSATYGPLINPTSHSTT